MSLKQSKWQRGRHIPIVYKFEEQAQATREQNEDYWTLMALPKHKPRRQQKHRKGKAPTTQTAAYAQVDKRDNKKCQHPGCYSDNTNHHHILFRSHGGKNDLENLTTLCLEHHNLGKNSPHKSVAWQRYWEGWAENLYPDYWKAIREGQKITQPYNNRITTQQEVAK